MDSEAAGEEAESGVTEAEAYRAYCKLRWPETDGAPICPRCGSSKYYPIPKRQKYRCANQRCRADYSPTTGTIFSHRKIPYTKLVAALAPIMGKGVSWPTSQRMAREIGVNQKSAWYLKDRVVAVIRNGKIPEREKNGNQTVPA